MMKLDLPVLKAWKIYAVQQVDSYLVPAASDITVEFRDFDVDMTVKFMCTDMGHLRPIVSKANCDFGKSYIYHDNQFVAFFMEQFVELGLMVI